MLNRKTLIPFLFLILTLSACSSLLTPRKALAETAYPIVSISPPVSMAAVGQTLNISVVISNAVDLFSYQVYINYSSEMLSVTNIYEGNLLARSGAYTPFWRVVYNNSQGLVQAAESLLRGNQMVQGGGVAFTVTFTVNQVGGSQLLLQNVILKNEFNIDFVPIFTQNATISTAAVEITPSLIRPTESNDYSINKTLTVNVTLDGAVNQLYGYDINVTYGKNVLRATAVNLLPLMGTPNTNQTLIENDEGIVSLSLECTPPAQATSTTGTLATITFQIINLGATNIEISENSTIADQNGNNLFALLGSADFNNQYATRNIGIVSSTLSTYEVTAGDYVTATTVLRNDGRTNETCQIIFQAFDVQNGTPALIAGPTVFTIGSNTTDSLNITLATTGLGGNYTVQGYLYYLPEETNYTDNTYNVTQQLLIHPVEESSSPFGTTFYVAVAIIVIIIAIVAAYALRRRRKPS